METTLQLPMRITLTALILVGSVFPATLKEEHNTSVTEIQSAPKNESNILPPSSFPIVVYQPKSINAKFVTPGEPSEVNANATDAPESASKIATIEKSNITALSNKTEKDVSANTKEEQTVEPVIRHLVDGNTTNGINKDIKKDDDNSTLSEQSDMLTSYVTPHDNDDTTFTESTQKPEASHKDELNDTSRTELLSSSTASAVIQHAQTVQINSRTKSEDNTVHGMPASIIALIIAITFGVALAIAYVSVIAWKRYLEHRYGHRELLVNDLEFDTNDLRHFEL